ncbi:hypothetical protein PO124_32950 [Bacillus licheniformis]|nr:hypothetical protein [Bacillus licheniformis]
MRMRNRPPPAYSRKIAIGDNAVEQELPAFVKSASYKKPLSFMMKRPDG